ncbi:hypothetical protein ACFL96_15095 [Thermoproteota archaeon]
MSSLILPPSIQLVYTIALQMEKIQGVFDPSTSVFRGLRELLNSETDLLNAPAFVNQPKYIIYIQVLICLGLSMHGGINVPILKAFEVKDNKVKIQWDSGIHDVFTFGVIDQEFLRFWSYYQAKIFGDTPKKSIYASYCEKFYILLNRYEKVLTAVKSWVQELQKGKSAMLKQMEEELTPSSLFLLVSSLQPEQINALFLFIQQFFPDKLTVKSAGGHEINVNTLFQTPSNDIKYLLEKVQTYFYLYTSDNRPIIRHITRIKTRAFLRELLQNEELYKKVSASLESLLNDQIQLRIKLYTLGKTHLEKLFAYVV